MSKRLNSFKRKPVKYKDRSVYPMMYCLDENKPIAVSKVRCAMKKLKVQEAHWNKDNAKFVQGYEFDITKYSVGEKVKCPKCGGLIDFRMWISDTEPDIK